MYRMSWSRSRMETEKVVRRPLFLGERQWGPKLKVSVGIKTRQPRWDSAGTEGWRDRTNSRTQ